MSEPIRWKDSPDAPIGMRELLGAARPTRELDDSTFHRGASRVGRLSIVPAIAAIGFWTKLTIAGSLAIVAAGSGVALKPHLEAYVAEPKDSTPAAPRATKSFVRAETPRALAVLPPVLVEERVKPQPLSLSSSPVPVPVPESTAPNSPPTPARERSTLADELALLERARSELPRSPSTSLAHLDAHRARFPAGVLAAERNLMELDALRRTGRLSDARDRANAWLARDPNGVYAARIREILDSP